MTTAELAKYIGQVGAYHGVPGLVVEVTVIDARVSWGQVHLQIQPTSGSGSKWVNTESYQNLVYPPRREVVLNANAESLGGIS